MALNTTTLKQAILDALNMADNSCKQPGATPIAVKTELANNLANAMEAFVKSGQVNPGIQVEVNTFGVGATIAPGTIS